MCKLYIILSLIISPSIAFSQYYWDWGIKLGASNYLGEMGGSDGSRKGFINDLKLSKTRPAGGIFLRYKATRIISGKVSLNYARISGDDALSTNIGRHERNLSFRNDIFEFGLEGQFSLYDIYDFGGSRTRNDFKTYVFSGVNGFYHNPKANLKGEWLALQPLKTEGQIKPYSPYGVSVPMGIGFLFTIDKKYRIGWEFAWMKTFTDYLDDVSTTYADPDVLGDPVAITLANRTNEITTDKSSLAQYVPGGKRGDPTHNDAYMYTTVNLSYVLRGKSSYYQSKYGSIFMGKKFKKRRSRAKF